ncbi:FAD-binding oxidoreductase [Rhodoblastus sp.]|uniref:FAD-binding oxidoreductase n=1 Tax=Rhodoblastus sp. TaxID=1962975 RepID=UPI003F9C3D4C
MGRNEALPALAAGERCIAFGAGRSYSDVCLNEGGVLLRTRRLDHFIAFDRATGRLTCDAGVQLKDVLDLATPQGWFLAVTPGTRFVTIGGAIANDVHGKNHHINGTFGHHVRRLELLRSNGERIVCGPDLRPEWFAATVGGLGLTGLITWAQVQLAPINNAFMITSAARFRRLEDFWTLNEQAEQDWPYTVSWIDCASKSTRGILLAGRHAPMRSGLPAVRERKLNFPLETPISLVNIASLRAFNVVYYHRPLPTDVGLTHYAPYFYPLDAILNWNRIYGARGFFQYQCVLPSGTSRDAIADLLTVIARSGAGSFLAVLKTFGSRPSVGMLSFARPGATLALDFPNHGPKTLGLFGELDAIVAEAGGALYPAKDARMPGEMFRKGFPAFERFSAFIDPGFSSSFWRRVSE